MQWLFSFVILLMQKLLCFCLLLSFCCLTGCNAKKKAAAPIVAVEEKKSFIPVTDIILGELAQIDSLPLAPLKLTTFEGKTDSVWMKKSDVRKWATPFLTPVIDSTNMRTLFTQRSFLDQTINAFTFSYDPIGALPDTLQLRRWDVYIDPQQQTVSRIYLVKASSIAGKSQTIQLTWKNGSWAKILIIPENENDPNKLKEEKVVWNFDN